MRGGIGHDRTGGRYWDARGDYFGRGSFFGRRSPQMGNADRAQIFFIVGSRFLTRIGIPACFAAAGFPRIESRGITEDGRGLGSKLLDQLFNYIIVAH